MTLPEDVIKALRARHADLARAVVALMEDANGHARPGRLERHGPAQLAEIAPRRFLITVDVNAVRALPGCELVPITRGTAFLALQPGCGLADLAVAVTDRLEERGLDEQERGALTQIRLALRAWMRDETLTCETRSIVVMRQVSFGMVLLSYWTASASALFSECEGILQRVLPQLIDTAARAAIVTSAL